MIKFLKKRIQILIILNHLLEFDDLSSIYTTLYSQGIASDYINSIFEQRKKDFNYTIKYYYSLTYKKTIIIICIIQK